MAVQELVAYVGCCPSRFSRRQRLTIAAIEAGCQAFGRRLVRRFQIRAGDSVE
jgi:hypothetical protein